MPTDTAGRTIHRLWGFGFGVPRFFEEVFDSSFTALEAWIRRDDVVLPSTMAEEPAVAPITAKAHDRKREATSTANVVVVTDDQKTASAGCATCTAAVAVRANTGRREEPLVNASLLATSRRHSIRVQFIHRTGN
jgi:hypothetical protein